MKKTFTIMAAILFACVAWYILYPVAECALTAAYIIGNVCVIIGITSYVKSKYGRADDSALLFAAMFFVDVAATSYFSFNVHVLRCVCLLCIGVYFSATLLITNEEGQTDNVGVHLTGVLCVATLAGAFIPSAVTYDYLVGTVVFLAYAALVVLIHTLPKAPMVKKWRCSNDR